MENSFIKLQIQHNNMPFILQEFRVPAPLLVRFVRTYSLYLLKGYETEASCLISKMSVYSYQQKCHHSKGYCSFS